MSKEELLYQAEELVKLSEDTLERVKSNPRLYDDEQVEIEQKILDLAKQLLENLKNK